MVDLGICLLTCSFIVHRLAYFALVSGVSRNRDGTTGSEWHSSVAQRLVQRRWPAHRSRNCQATKGEVSLTPGLGALEFWFDQSCYAAMMAQYLPRDWPEAVHPPGSEGWEATAVSRLLDPVPEYRQYTMVCRHPVILVSIARHLVHGSVGAPARGYRTVRTDLAGRVPPHAVDAALKAYRTEGRRLAATERAVELVARALRGERFLQAGV